MVLDTHNSPHINALVTEKTYKWANVCFFPCVVLAGSTPPLTEEGGARRL